MGRLLFSDHVRLRMYERGITRKDVMHILETGEVIEEYPNDYPFPSQLMLGWVRNEPIHIVVANDLDSGDQYLVTVYRPHPSRWTPDCRRRVR